jgi:hypothetical protein
VIFIHSSFRTASTYLWSCLRRSPRTLAYYEIFNETLATVAPTTLASSSPDGWYSKHPSGAPYFLEFLPLTREGGGVEGFEPAMSYARFIPDDGPGGVISEAERAYVARLIDHAERRGKIPVLTATRSLGRFAGLKAAFPGLHVLLYRNLFQQWCSFTDQAFRGNPYFLDRMAEIMRLNGHDPVLRDLLAVFPLDTVSTEDPNTFFIFVFLHVHLYAHAAAAADLIIDMNRLAKDPAHRQAVEDRIATQDIALDLSDVRNSIAYSLCRFGSTEDMIERLNVVGAMITDRVGSETGRAFGLKVIAELIEEFECHEFHIGAFRAIVFGRSPMLGHDLRAECDSLRAERDQLRAELDKTRSERDKRHKKRKRR